MINKTKEHFYELYEKSGITYDYPGHVQCVEDLSKKLLKKYPEADGEVTIISVWLHDVGTFIGDRSEHDVLSEKEAKSFLKKEGFEKEKIDKVAHCVRAHRCSDVKPETIEAKILAVCDSASHLVRSPYIRVQLSNGKESALGKLERDYRDMGLLPEVKEEFTPLYKAWKNLLELMPN